MLRPLWDLAEKRISTVSVQATRTTFVPGNPFKTVFDFLRPRTSSWRLNSWPRLKAMAETDSDDDDSPTGTVHGLWSNKRCLVIAVKGIPTVVSGRRQKYICVSAGFHVVSTGWRPEKCHSSTARLGPRSFLATPPWRGSEVSVGRSYGNSRTFLEDSDLRQVKHDLRDKANQGLKLS